MRLIDHLTEDRSPDALYEAFVEWSLADGIELYPHQDEAIVDILSGNNTIVTTPTGSGKTLIAVAAHFASLAAGTRSYYTAPIKALVSEKFFALCDIFGAENVGMVTGDVSVNSSAPIVCCTAEILANIALREGRSAAVDQVVVDEFHFISDPDRGWAWLVSLLELPQAQFIIMSATLGDVTSMARDMEKRSGRETSIIGGAVRPVPLDYAWSMRPMPETVELLIGEQKAPIYIVHATQSAAVERAQALLSAGLLDRSKREQIKEAMAQVRFASGFGQTLSKLLNNGIAVHHAGMLPRYRRLVEQLAQRGLVNVICGTDTLGVGINVPIRTVLFSTLSKFDGRRQRLLKAREFHQIAGRAGRAGFDTVGYVVAQAPDHEIENAIAVAKAGDDPKKLRRVKRKKAPDGFVNFTEATYRKIIDMEPEQLVPRMKITHATLLNLLERDQDTAEAVISLVHAATPDAATRRKLLRRALALGRSLIASGVVSRLDRPTPGGRKYQVALDLQKDFALNQPLSAFALAALDILDETSPTYALDVVSVIESTLEDPRQILLAQQFQKRGEVVAELKADGVEFDERQEILESVTWPKPLADVLEHAHRVMTETHPWLAETPVSPKAVVRDLFERAMTFGEFVAFYKLQRSEGLVLRYLSDAYRALRQTVPESRRTTEVEDLIEWLGEITRMVDSSLLDEWSNLAALAAGEEPVVAEAPRLTANTRAFTVMVRNAMFRRVELAAHDDVDALAALEAKGSPMDADAWDDALGEYWDEHDDILLDGDARGPALFVVDKYATKWHVRQIVADPEGNHDWSITAVVDLPASDEAEQLVLTTTSFARTDG
ncbi:DEAD/DEAH box helicase [Tessaracoccus caeni]|uniref:DEAD/DEAH box helicase n=1 Tax=Tessaracoccus caeni TaxID=3031239 RepID=UPI0023DB4EDD|nr:DEAD/DEAH box helicase [Tessaracoccus caeni]MDF1487460.1 DUF3516 domain-containing protein [Tessaracoccus caeni]